MALPLKGDPQTSSVNVFHRVPLSWRAKPQCPSCHVIARHARAPGVLPGDRPERRVRMRDPGRRPHGLGTGAARGNGRDRGRGNERTCADKPPPRPCRLSSGRELSSQSWRSGTIEHQGGPSLWDTVPDVPAEPEDRSGFDRSLQPLSRPVVPKRDLLGRLRHPTRHRSYGRPMVTHERRQSDRRGHASGICFVVLFIVAGWRCPQVQLFPTTRSINARSRSASGSFEAAAIP